MINLGPVTSSRNTTTSVLVSLLIFVIVIPTTVTGECTCEKRQDRDDTTNTSTLTYYKIGAVASILIAGGIGVSLPLVGRKIQALNPESDIFFMIKAFAAGVILATGFVHILPDAFQILTSPCLKDNPWGRFPFTGFVAMMSSICTLIIDTLATSFYKTRHFNDNSSNKPSYAAAANVADYDEGNAVDVVVVDHDHDHDEHAGHVHVHTHTSNGHAHGSATPAVPPELIRHRIISQVLELGIVVHSVIIGISLGASGNPETIKPLMAALSFHQFFEGMGLGGCISQAKFKSLSTVIMGVFFSVTAPIGIVIGIGVSRELSGGGGMMIVQGVFNSASAGILIYMALVDLLAADFMNPRMQANTRLQLGANISLLLGAGCMSVLAKWA